MRVGLVGLGVIGKRAADALATAPELELAGVAVRGVPAAVHCLPSVPYYASGDGVRRDLRRAGARVLGTFDDLLREADVVVDAGTSRTGAGRAGAYRAAGVRVLYCGGERDPGLGPLVHPALNAEVVPAARAVRLTSCNTTALGRVVAALGPPAVRRLDATVLRCSTDNDKAGKGITNGASLDSGASHHASDLTAIVAGLRASSRAATVPMTCGHVIDLRIETPLSAAEAIARMRVRPLVRVLEPDAVIDTAQLRAASARSGRRWSQRFELAVRVEPDSGAGGVLRCWLSLDNESITIPELLDVLHRWRVAGDVPDSTPSRQPETV